MAGGLDGQRLLAAGRNGDIDVERVGGDSLYRAFFAPESAADNADTRAVIVGDAAEFRAL